MMPAAQRPVRLALLGGGRGSFIGAVHQAAARRDNRFDLVAGVFSRTLEKSREQAFLWGVDPERAYASHEDMFRAEAGREDGIEAVAIATPNDSHFPIARAALDAGLHVICDKPMTATLEQARQLATQVEAAGRAFALTYTYTGYPMIREARARVAAGVLGAVRKVVVEYPQGWLWQPTDESNVQAAWRIDPERAGKGGCIGDIGVHAFQLLEHVSGLRVEELCADLPRLVPGRALDDDCNVLLRLEGGVPGVLIASQACPGERNGLRLRIYGERASLEWSHAAPGELRILTPDDRVEIVFAGAASLSPTSLAATRLPVGHPEGFVEAFANIYTDFAQAIRTGALATEVPGADEGLRSLEFIERAIASDAERRWLPFVEKAA